jgi:hypothetical protein
MTRYENPAFDPGIAFAWTLRSEQIARRQRPRAAQTYRGRLESKMPDETSVAERWAATQTPAFEPGTAFSWTLRAAEIARRQSRSPLESKPGTMRANILAAA